VRLNGIYRYIATWKSMENITRLLDIRGTNVELCALAKCIRITETGHYHVLFSNPIANHLNLIQLSIDQWTYRAGLHRFTRGQHISILLLSTDSDMIKLAYSSGVLFTRF